MGIRKRRYATSRVGVGFPGVETPGYQRVIATRLHRDSRQICEGRQRDAKLNATRTEIPKLYARWEELEAIKAGTAT